MVLLAGSIQKNWLCAGIDEVRILGRFPENHEFGSDCGHSLGLK
jgi:hypothetical protein